MSPRPSAECKLIGCHRSHHARGLCRIHYGEQVRKSAKKERSATRTSQAAQTGIHTERFAPLGPQEFGESDTSRSVGGPPQGVLTELPPSSR